MKKSLILGASLALLLGSVASSHADAVTVLNPSFEFVNGGGDYPPAADWFGSNFTENSASIGLSGGDLVRYNGQNAGNSASQDLGLSLQSNSVYTLTIAVATRTSDPGAPTGTTNFGLTLDGVDLGTFTSVPRVPDSNPTEQNVFRDFVYTFTTDASPASGSLGIRIGAVGGRAQVDNVRLDVSPVPVPEPSTALCALIGGSLIIARRRRA